MKTFFNVLYRRILYKIPLKFLLILLAVCAVFIACFSNADYIGNITPSAFSLQAGTIVDLNYNYPYCIYKGSSVDVVWYYSGDVNNQNNVGNSYLISCFSSGTVIKLYNKGSSSVNLFTYNLSFFPSQYTKSECKSVYGLISEDECTGGGQMTSSECQTIYNLIPISSVDSNYCQTNNLCPTCPDNPNIGTSNLYINDIFHPGAFNIIMNIPEEISRDYAYTNSGYNFNLDIEGYNVDYEKMQSVIDKQSYIPTNEDFQNIILLIGPYGKIIIFFVFLFILWAWIKKPFKSKL